MTTLAFLLRPKINLAHKQHVSLFLITFILQGGFQDNVEVDYRPMLSMKSLLLMTAESQPEEFR
jgi:hypothetical protein